MQPEVRVSPNRNVMFVSWGGIRAPGPTSCGPDRVLLGGELSGAITVFEHARAFDRTRNQHMSMFAPFTRNPISKFAKLL